MYVNVSLGLLLGVPEMHDSRLRRRGQMRAMWSTRHAQLKQHRMHAHPYKVSSLYMYTHPCTVFPPHEVLLMSDTL